MSVRPAEPDDAAGLALVHIRSWQEAYVGLIDQSVLDGLSDQLEARTDWWRRWWTTEPVPGAPETDVFVSADPRGGEVVGFITVTSRPDVTTPEVGEVRALYTRAAVGGRGVVRELWDAGVAHLADHGCTSATLWVLDSNARARAFYERQGWASDGATQVDEVWGATVTEVRYRGSLVS
jgi:ribosomal protein S18 acetylase RimI-like enzyme